MIETDRKKILFINFNKKILFIISVKKFFGVITIVNDIPYF